MSLKIRIPARLKSLYSGVALSKKSIEAITEKLSTGLTDESTDEEIDAVLNQRNELYSFDDQRKFDDYQAGKAAKEVADKEAAKKKAIEEGKTEEVEVPADAPEWFKAHIAAQAVKDKALEEKLAAFEAGKVTNTRREQYAKILEGKDEKFVASELKKFDKMSFKDDEDFTTTLAEFTQDISNMGLGNDRVAGGSGGAGFNKEASKAEVDSLLKNIM